MFDFRDLTEFTESLEKTKKKGVNLFSCPITHTQKFEIP
jgi:hypothetical protein